VELVLGTMMGDCHSYGCVEDGGAINRWNERPMPGSSLSESGSVGSGQVLDIDSLGQAGLIPFNIGQHDATIEGVDGLDLAMSRPHLPGRMVLAIKEALAVGDGIADYDGVRHFGLMELAEWLELCGSV
jgi:hypothetical protein